MWRLWRGGCRVEEESPAGVRAMSWAAESGVLTQQLQRNAFGSCVFGLVGKKILQASFQENELQRLEKGFIYSWKLVWYFAWGCLALSKGRQLPTEQALLSCAVTEQQHHCHSSAPENTSLLITCQCLRAGATVPSCPADVRPVDVWGTAVVPGQTAIGWLLAPLQTCGLGKTLLSNCCGSEVVPLLSGMMQLVEWVWVCCSPACFAFAIAF